MQFACLLIHLTVHGFEKTQYTVLEGDKVDVIFKRNVKSVTAFPLLTIEGSIVTEDINVDGKSESSETSENVYTL